MRLKICIKVLISVCFFGDKICTDGNDLDIAMRCAYYHNIESPADLILQLQEYK